jgi:hypothetical protein
MYFKELSNGTVLIKAPEARMKAELWGLHHPAMTSMIIRGFYPVTSMSSSGIFLDMDSDGEIFKKRIRSELLNYEFVIDDSADNMYFRKNNNTITVRAPESVIREKLTAINHPELIPA